ncbi:MAG: hypothetical protein AAFU67_19250, partial [Bacteroidota bacterium]
MTKIEVCGAGPGKIAVLASRIKKMPLLPIELPDKSMIPSTTPSFLLKAMMVLVLQLELKE